MERIKTAAQKASENLTMTMPQQQTVACELCGEPTPMMATKRCDRCWELENRMQRDPILTQKILRGMLAETEQSITHKRGELLVLSSGLEDDLIEGLIVTNQDIDLEKLLLEFIQESNPSFLHEDDVLISASEFISWMTQNHYARTIDYHNIHWGYSSVRLDLDELVTYCRKRKNQCSVDEAQRVRQARTENDKLRQTLHEIAYGEERDYPGSLAPASELRRWASEALK